MNAKEMVDSLFKDFEQTAALADFKEELLGNLNAKIDNLVKNGMDADAAFKKASMELGDVSVLADEMSLKKRKEVFHEVYMDIRQYMPVKRVGGYIAFGIVALFGVIVALIAFFATKETGLSTNIDLTVFFSALMPFMTVAVVGFTFLGVTQETASMNPVSAKRGAWYAVAAGLISFGLFTMPIIYFSSKVAVRFISEYSDEFINKFYLSNFEALIPVISMMIPFILPGIGILVFLILTEKNRLKPWAKDFHNKLVEREMAMWNDPVSASRFGMFSGAIWIFAIGVFILLGFAIGFKHSWLAFVFATAIQLIVQGFMSKQGSQKG